MKKIFIILLCVVFICSVFASCDKAEESKTDISEAESVSDTVSEAESESPSDSSEEVSEGASEESTNEALSFTITNTKDPNTGHSDAEEIFYSDEEYDYTFGTSPTYEFLIVEYSDGTKENIKEALENGNITIEDLDRFGIKYNKNSKSTGERVE